MPVGVGREIVWNPELEGVYGIQECEWGKD